MGPARRMSFRTILSALGIASSALLACRAAEPRASTAAAPTAAPTASAAAPATDPQKLVGRWLRSDSDYVIEIARVGADGSVEAKYFNPAPIHVSRSGWMSDGQHVGLLVEMTDRNYPGSYYTVAYDPGSDALVGTYHQLVQNQTYEVAFSRLSPPAPGKP